METVTGMRANAALASQGTHHHSAHERSLSAEFQKRRKGLLLRAGEDDAPRDAGPLAVVEVEEDPAAAAGREALAAVPEPHGAAGILRKVPREALVAIHNQPRVAAGQVPRHFESVENRAVPCGLSGEVCNLQYDGRRSPSLDAVYGLLLCLSLIVFSRFYRA